MLPAIVSGMVQAAWELSSQLMAIFSLSLTAPVVSAKVNPSGISLLASKVANTL